MKCGVRQFGPARVRVKVPGALPMDLRPHWRELTGFESAAQGQGHGTALLQRVCIEADAAGVGLMLLADDDRLVDWYARHGFSLLPGEARLMTRPAYGNCN